MKKMSIFALLLAAVVATSYSVSGTYAKYTTTFTSEADSARVAKWGFKVEEGTVTSNTFTFDLFNTVNDVDGEGNVVTETDVKVGEGETIIAPGTTGSFTIDLANQSEVSAAYTIDYTVNKGNIPLEFKVGTGEWKTTLEDVTTPVKINGFEGTDSITIEWRWTFEEADRDDEDTALGVAGTDKVTVSANITAVQVD